MRRTTKGRFMKRKEWEWYPKTFILGTIFGIFISLVLSGDQIQYAKADTNTIAVVDTSAPADIAHQIDVLSKKYDVNRELAEKIMSCESSFIKDATHKNVNGTTDHGIWQINSETWDKELQKKGLDPKGLEAGFYILANYGTKEWNASKACWSK